MIKKILPSFKIIPSSFFALYFTCFFSYTLSAQNPKIVAGPMIGHVTDTMCQAWCLIKDGNRISCNSFRLYKDADVPEGFVFPDIHRKDFSFLVGSCAFQTRNIITNLLLGPNRYKVFRKMTNTPSDFMIWLGDNIYYWRGEWNYYEKMYMKNVQQRMDKDMNTFLKSRPQYAIWDDHDFGPDNTDGNFKNKDAALQLFQQFWANPYYGLEYDGVQGIFSNFLWGDAEFFLIDGRYHSDKKKGILLGEKQMEWLKASLTASKANFKFICMGSQVLCDDEGVETLNNYPKERDELMLFLEENHISGAIFLSGDRHFSELSKKERPHTYPIYDFTCSGLTSPQMRLIHYKNSYRVKGSHHNRYNYGRIKLSGEGLERKCSFEIYGNNGKKLWDYAIFLKDLQTYPK